MPRYLVIARDYPGALLKRLSVREQHLHLTRTAHKAGEFESGGAFLGSPDHPAEGEQWDMNGSILVFQYSNIEQVWARVKADPYWTGDVWDKENVQVLPYMGFEPTAPKP